MGCVNQLPVLVAALSTVGESEQTAVLYMIQHVLFGSLAKIRAVGMRHSRTASFQCWLDF